MPDVFYFYYIAAVMAIVVACFWYRQKRATAKVDAETKTHRWPASRFELLIIDGPQKGERISLPTQAIIGRDYKHGIAISDPKISFKHALVVCEKHTCTIFDLGSRNKIYVNGRAVTNAQLRQRDKIVLGCTTLQFIADRSVPPAEAPQLKAQLPAESTQKPVVSPAVDFIQPKNGEASEVIVDRCANDIETIIAGRFGSERIEQVQQRFRLVCQISGMMRIGLSLKQILDETMQSLARFFPQVERGVIFLADSQTQELEPFISLNFANHSEEAVSVSSTVLSEAIDQRVAIMSSNAMKDKRFSGGESIMFQSIKMAMCAPLSIKDELLGAVYLDSTMTTGQFNQDDLALLVAVSSQIAIVIMNIRLHQSMVQAEKLKQELAIAQEIQQSLLPSRFPEIAAVDFAARTEPARQVGGDFYDVLSLGEDRVGLLIGDVSGKGIGAALYMAGLLSEFRFFARLPISPAEVFRRLNHELVAIGTRGMFVTMVYLVVDFANHKIDYINAGHHVPIVIRSGSCHDDFPGATTPPLGIFDNIEFFYRSLPLTKGQTIVLYTDGIIEARDAHNQEFGKECLQTTLLEAMATAASRPHCQHLLTEVFTRVKQFGYSQQRDDLTMLLIEL